METPFIFGKIATGVNFTDREKETRHLVDNFRSTINTMIISPRRWGKSSLVHKAAVEAMSAQSDLRICEVDLFNVRNEQEFYTMLAQSVLKATSTKWTEVKDATLHFMKSILPKIVLSSDPGMEFSLDLDWERAETNIDEIIDLAENIAKERGLKIIVCIDEFQNISYFSDALYLQKRLRSHWQRHQHVGYCLYGSKRHMLMDVFTNSSMPFYKFGDLIFLEKIGEEYLEQFIIQRFNDTGKQIDKGAAREITRLVDCHPYYTQQLAQLSWLRSDTKCDVAIVDEAHTALVEQLSLLFSTLTQPLTNQQVAFLKALCDGCKAMTSLASLNKYGFKSATAVIRARKALTELDIIDDIGDNISFQDPVYAYWLKHTYFK